MPYLKKKKTFVKHVLKTIKGTVGGYLEMMFWRLSWKYVFEGRLLEKFCDIENSAKI